MAYGDFKDLTRFNSFDKKLGDKAFNLAKNPKYDRCQWGLGSTVYKFFDKVSALQADKSASDGAIKNEICQTKNHLKNFTNQLLENLRKEKYTLLL